MFSLTCKKIPFFVVKYQKRSDVGDTTPPSGENTDDKNWAHCKQRGTDIYIKSQSCYTNVSQLIDLYLIKTLTHSTPLISS